MGRHIERVSRIERRRRIRKAARLAVVDVRGMASADAELRIARAQATLAPGGVVVVVDR